MQRRNNRAELLLQCLLKTLERLVIPAPELQIQAHLVESDGSETSGRTLELMSRPLDLLNRDGVQAGMVTPFSELRQAALGFPLECPGHFGHEIRPELVEFLEGLAADQAAS